MFLYPLYHGAKNYAEFLFTSENKKKCYVLFKYLQVVLFDKDTTVCEYMMTSNMNNNETANFPSNDMFIAHYAKKCLLAIFFISSFISIPII